MTFVVEFDSGPVPGRRVAITNDQPRTLRILFNGQEAGQVLFAVQGDKLQVVNRSGRPVSVNGTVIEQALVKAGDQLLIGKDAARILYEAQDTVTAPSDSQRRRRAISAEGTSTTTTSGRQGLITRVSTAIATRAERGREEELQRQRQDLLAQVGRRALEGERFGLSREAVHDLLAGTAVHLTPDEVDREALAWWRQARDRLDLIDAEIAALRQVAGLPPDPARSSSPVIRQDLRRQEERTYQTLDACATQDLDPLPVEETSSTRSSGRRRAAPLRPRRG